MEKTNVQRHEKVHQADDKGYRALLQSRKAFLQLLRYFVGLPWTEAIEEQSLQRVDKSFILQDFAGKEADLVYTCRLEGKDIIFYVLLELQSTVDHQMPWRLLQYMTEIWRSHLREHESAKRRQSGFRLPSIVPVVLYNGKPEWTAQRRFRDYQSECYRFDGHIVDFEYYLVDIARMDDAHLERLEGMLPLALRLERAGGYESLLVRLKHSLDALQKLDDTELGLLQAFVLRVLAPFVETPEAEALRQALVGSQEGLEMVSNISRILQKEIAKNRKEGLQEGILEGRQEGILEGRQEGLQEGLDLARRTIARKMIQDGMMETKVADMTGLSVDEIHVIALELRQS